MIPVPKAVSIMLRIASDHGDEREAKYYENKKNLCFDSAYALNDLGGNTYFRLIYEHRNQHEMEPRCI